LQALLLLIAKSAFLSPATAASYLSFLMDGFREMAVFQAPIVAIRIIAAIMLVEAMETGM
jgi:hypothetical protein